METFSFPWLSCQSMCLPSVAYTHGGVLVNFKQALKFFIPAGMRVTLSSLGGAVEQALKLQFLHLLQPNTTHQAASWHVKKARAPGSFVYEVRVCSTLEDFLSEMLCLPYRGFTHSCLLISDSWSLGL